MKIKLNITIDPEVGEILSSKAKERGLSKSSYISLLITQGIRPEQNNKVLQGLNRLDLIEELNVLFEDIKKLKGEDERIPYVQIQESINQQNEFQKKVMAKLKDIQSLVKDNVSPSGYQEDF